MDNLKFLDVVLFPKSFYRKVTDKKLTLYLGIVFVGLVDLAFPLADNLTRYFKGKAQPVMIFNAGLVPTFAILLGLIDVMFFSLPLFDLFKFFKRKEPVAIDGSLLVRVMKVYIMAHFIIVPVEAVIFYTLSNMKMSSLTFASTSLLIFIYVFSEIVIPVWFSAAITRGFNVIYKFEQAFMRLTFITILTWNLLLNYAFKYMMDHWLLRLFK